MLAWKSRSHGQTALLIDGARRVGKSYIVNLFAENEYHSHILIDFGRVSAEVLDLFEHDSADFDLFFAKLSVYFSTPRYSSIRRHGSLSSTSWLMGDMTTSRPAH